MPDYDYGSSEDDEPCDYRVVAPNKVGPKAWERYGDIVSAIRLGRTPIEVVPAPKMKVSPGVDVELREHQGERHSAPEGKGVHRLGARVRLHYGPFIFRQEFDLPND